MSVDSFFKVTRWHRVNICYSTRRTSFFHLFVNTIVNVCSLFMDFCYFSFSILVVVSLLANDCFVLSKFAFKVLLLLSCLPLHSVPFYIFPSFFCCDWSSLWLSWIELTVHNVHRVHIFKVLVWYDTWMSGQQKYSALLPCVFGGR